MILRKGAFLVLINSIPFLLLLIHLTDLFSVINSAGSYPFGHLINATGSIYTSQTIYIIYCIIQIIFLFSLIGLSLFHRRYNKVYFMCLAINILLFIYPIITLRD